MTFEPGFYADLPIDQYHADKLATSPSLSHTIAEMMIARCPAAAAFEHPRINPQFSPSNNKDVSKAMLLGTLAHTLLLGRGTPYEVLAFDSRRTKAAREAKEAAEDAGILPVTRPEYQQAAAMVTAARKRLAAIDLYAFDSQYGHAELCALAQDPVGPWTRALIDWYGAEHPDGVQVWDYKTTSGSANPDALKWHVTRQGWAFQAAFYDRILCVLKPHLAGKIRYKFFCQEVDPPYLCSVVEPAPDAMVLGHKMAAAAIGLWHWCTTHEQWPGYSPEAKLIGIMPNVEAAWVEREYDPLLRQIIDADPFLIRPVTAPEPLAAEPVLPDVKGDDEKESDRPPLCPPKRKPGRPAKTAEERETARLEREAARKERAARAAQARADQLPRKLDL